jgi:hypothetical protein
VFHRIGGEPHGTKILITCNLAATCAESACKIDAVLADEPEDFHTDPGPRYYRLMTNKALVKKLARRLGNRFWFRAKRYGWGTPCTWQGWVVTVADLAVVVGWSGISSGTASLRIILSLLCCRSSRQWQS